MSTQPEAGPVVRTRLVLVRHGQTDANASGRFQGHLDVPLNRIGHKQAKAVADRVALMKPTRIVSSDLSRARDTADAIAEASGIACETDRRLREIDVGSWQGLTIADVSQAHPWMPEAIAEGRDFRRSDTGETAGEAGARVARALVDLAAERPGETTVVVGHGLSLRIGLALVSGLGFAGSFSLAGLWNCSWSIAELNERWRILTYNSVVSGRGA